MEDNFDNNHHHLHVKFLLKQSRGPSPSEDDVIGFMYIAYARWWYDGIYIAGGKWGLRRTNSTYHSPTPLIICIHLQRSRILQITNKMQHVNQPRHRSLTSSNLPPDALSSSKCNSIPIEVHCHSESCQNNKTNHQVLRNLRFFLEPIWHFFSELIREILSASDILPWLRTVSKETCWGSLPTFLHQNEVQSNNEFFNSVFLCWVYRWIWCLLYFVVEFQVLQCLLIVVTMIQKNGIVSQLLGISF